MNSLLIRPVASDDAPKIAHIYNHYVLTTAISFEETPVTVDEMAARIKKTTEATLPWLVGEVSGEIVGYAYASKWKERHAYRFTIEASVYLAPHAGSKGFGTQLYGVLFPLLKAGGYRSVIGGIALPNEASIALHEKFGLKKVAHFSNVGYKFERWHDVGNWHGPL